MQVIPFDGCQELANLIDEELDPTTKVLHIEDNGGVRLYVVERDGLDVLVVACGSNSGFVIYGDAIDGKWGGSVHDLARNGEPVQS